MISIRIIFRPLFGVLIISFLLPVMSACKEDKTPQIGEQKIATKWTGIIQHINLKDSIISLRTPKHKSLSIRWTFSTVVVRNGKVAGIHLLRRWHTVGVKVAIDAGKLMAEEMEILE